MRASMAATFVLLIGLSVPAGADDTDPNNPDNKLTQREYNQTTAISPSPEHATTPAAPPTAVHSLTDPTKAALNTVHAQKIIGGKRWKRMSPQQRDDQLRALQESAPKGTSFILEVATGDVYLVPPDDPTNADADYRKAMNDLQGVPPGSGTGLIKPWQLWEFDKLPVAVGNVPSSGPSTGRRGEPVAVVKAEFKF